MYWEIFYAPIIMALRKRVQARYITTSTRELPGVMVRFSVICICYTQVIYDILVERQQYREQEPLDSSQDVQVATIAYRLLIDEEP